MGTRYICDVCGKEYDVKERGITPTGYPMSVDLPDKWAIISYFAPKEPEPQPKPSPIFVGRMPKGFLVCSQPCAEKALGKVRDHLRETFRKVA